MGKNILVIGSEGQIGTELVQKLISVYGASFIFTSDIKDRFESDGTKSDRHFILDSRDFHKLIEIVRGNSIKTIYHLASLLSVTGEQNPDLSWDININGFLNVLNVCKDNKVQLFTPSSIACFGPNTPKDNTPQTTIQRPSTIYGITKVTIELLSDYYVKKYDMDIRGIRYPGIISYKKEPGGGTTDYAVKIYFDAKRYGKFTCPLKENTYMDMMYIDDAIDSTIQLMESPKSNLKNPNSYNITSFSASPIEFFESIKKKIPTFSMDYDLRNDLQQIADSWPNSLDSSCAKAEWGFSPKYDLEKLTEVMLKNIK